MTRLILTLTTAAAILLPGTIRADSLTITSPDNGATVSRTFELDGIATGGAGLGITIDGEAYVAPADRGNSGHPAGAGQANADGRFSLQIDLNGEGVVSDGTGTHGVSAGEHVITVKEFFYNGQPGQPSKADITVHVTADTSSPAVTASPAVVADSEAWLPTAAIAGGLLVLAGLLGLGYRLSRG